MNLFSKLFNTATIIPSMFFFGPKKHHAKLAEKISNHFK